MVLRFILRVIITRYELLQKKRVAINREPSVIDEKKTQLRYDDSLEEGDP